MKTNLYTEREKKGRQRYPTSTGVQQYWYHKNANFCRIPVAPVPLAVFVNCCELPLLLVPTR